MTLGRGIELSCRPIEERKWSGCPAASGYPAASPPSSRRQRERHRPTAAAAAPAAGAPAAGAPEAAVASPSISQIGATLPFWKWQKWLSPALINSNTWPHSIGLTSSCHKNIAWRKERGKIQQKRRALCHWPPASRDPPLSTDVFLLFVVFVLIDLFRARYHPPGDFDSFFLSLPVSFHSVADERYFNSIQFQTLIRFESQSKRLLNDSMGFDWIWFEFLPRASLQSNGRDLIQSDLIRFGNDGGEFMWIFFQKERGRERESNSPKTETPSKLIWL